MKIRYLNVMLFLGCLSLLFNCGGRPNLLVNPGFEDKDPDKTFPNQWEQETYRDWVIFKADDTVKHSGKYSLLVENTGPNDSAFFQTVTLEAGIEYELSGWIKTEAVQPSPENNPPTLDLGATVCVATTYPQIWHAGQHQGTADWTYVSVRFTPEETKAYGVKARLGMWGNIAQGKAWYDDLSLVVVGRKGTGAGAFLLIIILILAGLGIGLFFFLRRQKRQPQSRSVPAGTTGANEQKADAAKETAAPEKQLPLWGKILVPVAIAIVTVLLLEGVIRIYEAIQDSNANEQAVTINRTVNRPANEVLILAAGESTMLGDPYGPVIDSPKILTHYLNKVYPDINFRTIMSGRGGITLGQIYPFIMNHLTVDQPDMFILCVGHNDFLGNYNYNQMCKNPTDPVYNSIKFSHLLLFFYNRLQRKNIDKLDTSEKRYFFDYPVVSDAENKSRMDDFRNKLMSLASIAAKNKIPTIFIFPGSNEAACEPNRSVFTGNPELKDQFYETYKESRKLLARGQYQAAYDELQKAKAIDGNFAEVLYRLGQASVGLGKRDEAARYFEAAKENDAFPYRARNIQYQAMREAGAKYNIPVIDARQLIKAVSPTGLLDDNVFHDIHHPTISGYHAMSKELTKIVLERKMIRPGEVKLPEFETDNQILEDFHFSSNDWLKMYISRVYHFEQLTKVLADPTDRLKELVRQLEIIKNINNTFYSNYLNVNGFEKNILKRLEEGMSQWDEKLDTFDKQELLNKMKSFIAFTDIAPLTISGVPSEFKYSKIEIEKGLLHYGRQITVLDQIYSDSFSLQPAEKYPAVVYFALADKYKAFSCQLGVADESKPEATVRNEIIADGKVLYTSPVMKKGMAPISVRVNLTGVRDFQLVSHLVGEDIDANYAVWIGSRFE